MGKRELLLAIAFVFAGATVYHFTAPPPAPGERSFSVGRIIEHIRREVRGNRASAELTTTSTHPIDAAISELRLGMRIGDVTVSGEDRRDMSAELHVRSNGYDDDEARRLAKETVLKVERAGSRVVAEVSFPRAGRQQAKLILRVPARLQLRLDSSSGPLQVSNVADVEVASRGEAVIRSIKGRVSGTHRGGSIAITDSGSLKLTANGSEVRLERIRGEASVNMRSGELKGSELAGPVDLDTNGTNVLLEKLQKTTGILRINAVSGSVAVKGLRTEGRVDVRNAAVDVILERAVPLAIYSDGGETVDLTPPPGGYQLDAVARDASITVPEGTVDVSTTGEEKRATGPVRGGGPTITIRTSHGAIRVRAEKP